MRMSRRLASGVGGYEFYDYIGNNMLSVVDGTQPNIETPVSHKKVKFYGQFYLDRGLMPDDNDEASLVCRELERDSSFSSSQSGSILVKFGLCRYNFELEFPNSSGGTSLEGRFFPGSGGLSNDWHILSLSTTCNLSGIASFKYNVSFDNTSYFNEATGYGAGRLEQLGSAKWSLFSYPPLIGSANKFPSGWAPDSRAFCGKIKLMQIKDLATNTVVARLKPCKRKCDGMIGMYDTVSNQFCPARNGSGNPTSFYVGNV